MCEVSVVFRTVWTSRTQFCVAKRESMTLSILHRQCLSLHKDGHVHNLAGDLLLRHNKAVGARVPPEVATVKFRRTRGMGICVCAATGFATQHHRRQGQLPLHRGNLFICLCMAHEQNFPLTLEPKHSKKESALTYNSHVQRWSTVKKRDRVSRCFCPRLFAGQLPFTGVVTMALEHTVWLDPAKCI